MYTNGNFNGSGIAVVGMSCRFPGAPDIRQFWQNLLNGRQSITFFPEEDLLKAGVGRNLLDHPDFVPSLGGILEDKDKFDHFFFGLSPNEALFLDPQIRIFLEAAWHALEDAAYPFASAGRRPLTGIFAGASNSVVWQARALLSEKENDIGLFQLQTLINKDLLAMRTAHLLDLRGPVLTLNTACSTSLVAVHLACQSLLNGECGLALAGGVSMGYYTIGGYLYRAGSISSSQGLIRAFDEGADGIAGGEGVGLVVLKRLEDAIEDKDNIYAVIRSSVINNDGKQKAGFSTPGIQGQAGVIRAAHRLAGIDSGQISYVETHGSGTPLGDLTEIEALNLAFATDRRGYCGIGSVKTNIGHTDVASGIAGMIKTILSVHHRTIPPSLSFEIPNLRIDWMNSPFYLVGEPTPFPDNKPIYTGISSFGVGGTNAHVIVGEAPALQHQRHRKDAPSHRENLFLLSAATPTAFTAGKQAMLDSMAGLAGQDPNDIAYTLQVARKPLRYRYAFTAGSLDECSRQLRDSLQAPPPPLMPESPQMLWYLHESDPDDPTNLSLYTDSPLFRQITDKVMQEIETALLNEYGFLQEKEAQAIRSGLWKIFNPYIEARFLASLVKYPQKLIVFRQAALTAPLLAGALDLRQH